MAAIREPGEEYAIDPLVAKAVLTRLEGRVRESLAGGGVAAAAALALAMLDGALAIACGLGGVVGLMIAACARADRVALLHRLARQRSAYEIDAVRATAERMASPELRGRVSRSLGQLVLEADGLAPSHSPDAMLERVRQNRSELIGLAFHLARPDSRMHPSAVLALAAALTNAVESPLYNVRIPPHALRSLLLRAQASVQTPATR